MNNAPFKIGQKVVCISSSPGGNYIKGKEYTVAICFLTPCCKDWRVGCSECPAEQDSVWDCICGESTKIDFIRHYYCCKAFRLAPIQTNYSDATEEILEKFKQTEETPDKILIPEKITQ